MVHEWTTITGVTYVRSHFQAESSVVAVQVTTCGGRGRTVSAAKCAARYCYTISVRHAVVSN